MTRALRQSGLILLGGFSLAALGMGTSTDDRNWQRIRSFPREVRLHLTGKLKEYDTLDQPSRDAIRKLDSRLADLPESDRANYLAVLRRYHLWLSALPESQRNEINAQPLEKRMALVSRIAAEQTTRPKTTSPVVLRYSDFGDFSPYDLADQVRTWQTLSPAQQNEISRYEEQRRQNRMAQLAREHRITPVTRPDRTQQEATFERALKGNLGAFWNARTKDDTPKAARAKLRILDHLVFLEKPPDPVKLERLTRFVATLPPWIRSLYDPLPPDEARRRLSIIYRLIYPSPAEFVEAKPAPPKAATAPATAPAPASAPAATKLVPTAPLPPGKPATHAPAPAPAKAVPSTTPF